MPFINDELYGAAAVSDGLGGKPAPATLAKWRGRATGRSSFGSAGRRSIAGRTSMRGSRVETVSHTITTPAPHRQSKPPSVRPRRQSPREQDGPNRPAA